MTDNFAARILNKLITFYELLSAHQRFSCVFCCRSSAQKAIDWSILGSLAGYSAGWLALRATITAILFGRQTFGLNFVSITCKCIKSFVFVVAFFLCVLFFLDTSSLKAKQIAVRWTFTNRQAAKRTGSMRVANVPYLAEMIVELKHLTFDACKDRTIDWPLHWRINRCIIKINRIHLNWCIYR